MAVPTLIIISWVVVPERFKIFDVVAPATYRSVPSILKLNTSSTTVVTKPPSSVPSSPNLAIFWGSDK